VSGREREIIVSREFRPAPDACTRALELLLKPASKKATRLGGPERPERIEDDPARSILHK
jgi:hypothetical protein